MRTLLTAVALTSAFLIAGPAFADSSASANKPDLDKIVCKSLPPPTGTRLGGRRVCKTERQWEQEQQRAQQSLSKTQIQRGTGGGN